MNALVLRSPSLAEGGDVRVVRLYEVTPFARGGLAKSSRREVVMHLSPRETQALKDRWGTPRRNPSTGADEYAFRMGSLAPVMRRADGGTTTTPDAEKPFRTQTGVAPDYYTYGQGPEASFYTPSVFTPPPVTRAPAAATPVAPRAAGPSSTQKLGAVLAGGADIANILGYNNVYTQGAGTLGNLATGNYPAALKSGIGLYRSLTAPSMADYASGKALDAALAEKGITGDVSAAAQGAEGAAPAAAEGAEAAGGTSALSRGMSGLGGALNVYSGLKQGGFEGYGQAATGAAQLGSAAGVGGSAVSQAVPILGAVTGGYGTLKSIQAGDTKNAAMSGAATGASIGSIVPGIGTALGAVIGGLVGAAGAAIHGKEDPEKKVTSGYYDLIGKTGATDTQQTVDPKAFYQAVAGEFRGKHSAFPPRSSGKYGRMDEDSFIADMGTKINDAYNAGTIDKSANAQDILNKVVTPWFEKDFGGWRSDIPQQWVNDQKSMTLDLINRYISGSPVDWGVITTGSANKDHPVPTYAGLGHAQGGLAALGHVRGPGSGRSDSIPAQLSDGEYVLTAEDVSLLGDGSNEAGARRLDEMRRALRRHKGGALARGKISPNAKAPMQYLKGAPA